MTVHSSCGVNPYRLELVHSRPWRNAWDQIDWDQADRAVLRLQARIAKATEVGRWNKVKTLQRILTRSFYAQGFGG